MNVTLPSYHDMVIVSTQLTKFCNPICPISTEIGSLLTTSCPMPHDNRRRLSVTTTCYLTCTMITEAGFLFTTTCYLTCTMVTEADIMLLKSAYVKSMNRNLVISNIPCECRVRKTLKYWKFMNAQFFFTKLPSCVDIIRRTSLGFPSWCPESTRPTDSCFQGTTCENLIMYSEIILTHSTGFVYVSHDTK